MDDDMEEELRAEIIRLRAKLLAADNRHLRAEMSAATEKLLRDLVGELSAVLDRLRGERNELLAALKGVRPCDDIECISCPERAALIARIEGKP